VRLVLNRFTPLRSHRPVAGRDRADEPGGWLAASPEDQGNRQDAKEAAVRIDPDAALDGLAHAVIGAAIEVQVVS